MRGTSLDQVELFLESGSYSALFRRENFTFLFRLVVCHLRCSLRLIHPNFDIMHQESVAKREDRVLERGKQAEVEITKKLKEV